MIRFFFVNPDGDAEEFTERVNLDQSSVILTTHAEQGTVGSCVIVVDDKLGDWNITGHRAIWVHEDTADYERTWFGFVAERDIKRMNPKVLSSRQWHITATDINTLFGRRIMRGSDCNRPAETDVERIQWLSGTTEQAFIDDDTTYLSTDGPVDMDAVDYRNQYATQIYDDCSQASGKNWFLYPYFDSPDWKIGIWYGHGGLTDYSSSIRISNDLDDIDGVTTFYPLSDENLNRSPSRVFSGVLMPYDGGTVYHTMASTIANFASRDTSAPMVNVKTNAKASARSFRYLHTINTEEDVIDASILVPPSQVNDVLAGQRMEAKFTHLAPWYDTFTWMRVLKKTTTFLTPRWYQLDLTLSAQPPPPSTDNFLIAFVGQAAETPLIDLSDNEWTLASWSGDFTDFSVIPCGAGPPQNQAMGMYYRAIVPGESADVLSMQPPVNASCGIWVYEIGGCDMSGLTVIDGNAHVANAGTAAVSGTATEESVLFGGVAFGKVDYDDGWCAGGLYASEILTDTAGTELVNKSSFNNCNEGPCPWCWIAYATGIGTLTISVTADAHGAGSGAYTCGWNVGTAGLLIPAPGGFSIVQSKFGGRTGISGSPIDITLDSPPVP